ncbi:hypothetical protein AB0F88_17915 [Streptosporangium sp. NPDC023963]
MRQAVFGRASLRVWQAGTSVVARFVVDGAPALPHDPACEFVVLSRA